MKKHLIFLAFLIVTGCANKEPSFFACPSAGLLRDADSLPVFSGAADNSQIAMIGSIAGFDGACDPQKDGSVKIEIKVGVAATRGPLGQNIKKQKFPYFVAVLSKNEDIIQRQAFDIEVDIGDKQSAIDTGEHNLVLTPDMQADKIVAGFVLTPEQVTFNRLSQESAAKKVKP